MPAQAALLDVRAVDLGPGVRAGFTSRGGGVSEGAWESLNLALHVDDEPRHVAANRGRLEEWAGAPVHWAEQVHGADVLVVTAELASGGLTTHRGAHGVDALVTAQPDVALATLVADCLPVLLADPQAGVVAAAHAGRRGLVAGVLPATLEAMCGLGARAYRCRAVIGPSAGACCYEVPAEMRAEVEQAVPGVAATTRDGRPALDLVAGAVRQLRRAGVDLVEVVGGCTIHDERYFSHRRATREGVAVTGRQAGVVRLLAQDR